MYGCSLLAGSRGLDPLCGTDSSLIKASESDWARQGKKVILGATIIQALFLFAVDNKVDFVERPLNGIAGKHVANLCCGDTLGWFTAMHAHEKIDEQVRDVARQQWAAAFWDVAEELWGGGE